MMTKFNKDMYAKMRSKKDEPLSSIGKKGVRVTGKGPFVTSVTSATPIVYSVETVRTASPATPVEEIPTPSSKRPCISGREKEKADSYLSIVWSDEGLAVDRAHEIVTAVDLKVFTGVPFNVVANQQVLCTDDFIFLFRCWGRASISFLSISLRRPRWRR